MGIEKILLMLAIGIKSKEEFRSTPNKVIKITYVVAKISLKWRLNRDFVV